MWKRWRLALVVGCSVVGLAAVAGGHFLATPPARVPWRGPTAPAPGIAWFATLDSGLREAQRTGRPILLVAAAPHCAGVSGMW